MPAKYTILIQETWNWKSGRVIVETSRGLELVKWSRKAGKSTRMSRAPAEADPSNCHGIGLRGPKKIRERSRAVKICQKDRKHKLDMKLVDGTL